MKKFYIGMDIGTDSVGMACTDEEYELLRAKGKDLISVRLFDEANDATSRRSKRSARRRLQRRNQRIDFLQDVFSQTIDTGLFFLRLNNSGFHFEDKDESLNSKFSLFDDESYTDREFYKQYPTIFHLRHELINGDARKDWRFYYLALHHIIKYRGHFLYEGQDFNSIRDIRGLIENLNNTYVEIFPEEDILFSMDNAYRIGELLNATGLKYKDKVTQIISLATNSNEKTKAIVIMMLGYKVKLSSILEKPFESDSIAFKDMGEEEFEALQDEVGDDFGLLQRIKEIYNFAVLERILGGNSEISGAMIGIYEQHKRDLQLLKTFIKTNYPHSVYYEIFRDVKQKDNYVNYIGYNKSAGVKIQVKKCTNVDNFYKFLKKALLKHNDNFDEQTYKIILDRIEAGNFLPKIINADNGIFPYQINLYELDKLLNNLTRFYPEFSVKDETGFSAAEKIRKIFLFRIPYYVGPLNNYYENDGEGNSWVVRKSGKITPWNFDDMVDKASSNQKFIRRMTNKCTYLIGKDVLPKCSIIYQKFNTLNQLNKIKINEVPLNVHLKQDLFNDLFLKHRKVTDKIIKSYLVEQGLIFPGEEKETLISGKDDELDASMSSYITLKNILGNFVDDNIAVCEDIILWHTLNTDKSIVEKLILDKYGNIKVIADNIKKLKGITSFKDFGRLSKEFLCELYGGVDPVTEQNYTILGELYNTNKNLNEILNDDAYTFLKAIDEVNGVRKENITYDDIKELYISPKVRRGVWQSMLMVDEYVNAVGRAPDKIFIEVTREEGEKKRTVARKNFIAELYNSCKKDVVEINELLNELNGKDDLSLRSERLYLYFLQLGRCMYTGKRINLEELSSDLYDVDHIIPQSLVKDDSIDNKVLVLKTKNKEKTDIYPLPLGFTDQQHFWKLLKEKGLISEKKYSRLTRTEPLNGDDFNNFIARQLVETNQTIKAVADLLKRKFASSDTKIVYSRASLVSDFRKKFNLIKCRETNDLHHARDAYLNIVVGNAYDTKFSCAYDYYYKRNAEWRKYNLVTMFNFPISGAWEPNTSLNIVKQTLSKAKNIMVTRYAYINKGQFYDETVFNKNDKGIDAPRKNIFPYNQTDKYGGYKSLTTAYFAIVKSTGKKGEIKTIERVPVLIDYMLRQDPNAFIKYLTDKVGLIDPQIVVPKLKIKTLVSINGTRAWLAGVTGNQIVIHLAEQWYTSQEIDSYIKALDKLISAAKEGVIKDEESEVYEIKTNRFNKSQLNITREDNLKLYDSVITQLERKIYQGISGLTFFKDKIIKLRPKFEELTVLNQAKVLMQYINILQCNSLLVDLTLFGESSTCGKISINKDITNTDFRIIYTSPCGLHTKEIKI